MSAPVPPDDGARVGVLLSSAVLDTPPEEAYDDITRYGGEEFALILPETDHAGAMVMAERCRRAIARLAWDKRPVTVSVGVSTLALDTGGAAALVKQAADALYRSKQNGRNRVTHHSGNLPPVPARV